MNSGASYLVRPVYKPLAAFFLTFFLISFTHKRWVPPHTHTHDPLPLGHPASPHVLALARAFTFTDYLHLDPEGRSLGTAFEYWKPSFHGRRDDAFAPLENALVTLIGCNLAGTSTVVAKREALRNANGFAEDLPSAEDWDLWLRLALAGTVAVSTRVTTNYLVRPGSETANRAARIEKVQAGSIEEARSKAIQAASAVEVIL